MCIRDRINISEIFFNSPPFLPIKEIIFRLFFFPIFAALIKLIDAFDILSPPPVDNKKRISPFWPFASTCLSKKEWKLKSFDHAVNAALLVVKEIAEKGFRFLLLNVQTSSPVKCSASAHDPPFPTTSSFFLFLLHLIISSDILITVSYTHLTLPTTPYV